MNPVPPPIQGPGGPPVQPQMPFYSGPRCVRCGNPNIAPVRYTWWGGVLGPKLFNLMRCTGCRYQWNGKTGKDPTTAIIVYNVFFIGLAFIIGLVWVLSRR